LSNRSFIGGFIIKIVEYMEDDVYKEYHRGEPRRAWEGAAQMGEGKVRRSRAVRGQK